MTMTEPGFPVRITRGVPVVIAPEEVDMACDEDSCRILSQLIRSGRSPVAVGGWWCGSGRRG
jgi:hypothetical protein